MVGRSSRRSTASRSNRSPAASTPAYPERTTPIPGCETDAPTTYEEIAQYSAFYCMDGDFMVYDDGPSGVLAQLAGEFGPSILGVVFAHEYGHAIQARAGVLDRDLPTIVTEQQADCFAGAWVAHVRNGGAEGITFTDDDVRSGLVAMITVRDPIGIDQFEAGGHGSAFDRVGAFQTGFTAGAARCAELVDDPLPLVPNTFRGQRRRDGNADFGYAEGEVLSFLPTDLQAYWDGALGRAGRDDADADARAGRSRRTRSPATSPPGRSSTGAVYCPATQQVFFDEPLARDLYDRFGDFVVGYMLGGAWSEAAQTALGSSLTGEPRFLVDDCLTGAWAATAIPDEDGTDRRAARSSNRATSTRRSRPRSWSATTRRPTTSSAAASRRSPASAKVCSMASRPASPGSATDVVAPTATATGADASPVLAALDIGTNSFHLVVARAVGDDRFETLTREKEVVRLGHGGGDMKELSPDAIERGVACLRRMRRIVDSYGATLRAVATSAVREAANAGVFLDRARREAGIEIEVISGAEEARLIHLGVLQAVPVFDRRLLLVDIGGGSTELLIGEKGETLAARSFKLGAVRLTDRFFPAGVATAKQVAACRDVRPRHPQPLPAGGRRARLRRRRRVVGDGRGGRPHRPRAVPAPSRSRPTTASRSQRRRRARRRQRADVRHRTAAARARVPGLEPGRADIAVAGALILETVADDVRRRVVHVQRGGAARRRARRHAGADLAARRRRTAGPAGCTTCATCPGAASASSPSAATTTRPTRPTSPGWRSSCSTRSQPLHDLDGTAREYLEAGALLANVGLVVAHSKHHLHAYYVIRNSELAGLTDLEIEIIAQIARYHRKSEPKPSHAEFAALDADDQAARADARRHPARGHRARPQPPRTRRVGAGRGPAAPRRRVRHAPPGRRRRSRAVRRQRAQGPARARHRPPRRAAPGLTRPRSARSAVSGPGSAGCAARRAAPTSRARSSR